MGEASPRGKYAAPADGAAGRLMFPIAVFAGNRCGRMIPGRMNKEEDKVRIVPVRPIDRLFGVLKREGPVVSLEEMEQAIAEGACEGNAPERNPVGPGGLEPPTH